MRLVRAKATDIDADTCPKKSYTFTLRQFLIQPSSIPTTGAEALSMEV
jgi:hypothetical protein